MDLKRLFKSFLRHITSYFLGDFPRIYDDSPKYGGTLIESNGDGLQGKWRRQEAWYLCMLFTAYKLYRECLLVVLKMSINF